jgi:hypothetical protein
VSIYDKAVIAHRKALVLQRVDNDKLKCPCALVEYCQEAVQTNNLLACELSDASCHITLETSGHAKFGNCAEGGVEQEHWYLTGAVRFGSRRDGAQ